MGRGIRGTDGGRVAVSVVDDHPDLCLGVLARFRESSLFVAGVEAATVSEFLALDAHAGRRSDVVLLDLTLKDGSSPAQNVARLKDRDYGVVIYTGEERPDRLQGSLGIGADALVRKEEASRLEEAIVAAVSGNRAWVSPLMAKVVLEARDGPRLTPAQVEVLRLYATGIPVPKIASVRHCSEETVRTHLRAVKARYGARGDAVSTRTDLLRVALRDRYVAEDWYRRSQ